MSDSRGRPTASDIPDDRVLSLLDPQQWTSTWALAEQLSEYPEKVVWAKCKQLLKRGLIDGCGCGCRGDWHLVETTAS